MGKGGSLSESGKKRGKGEAEEARKQPGNIPNQKLVLKRSNIVSTSSCQCQCGLCCQLHEAPRSTSNQRKANNGGGQGHHYKLMQMQFLDKQIPQYENLATYDKRKSSTSQQKRTNTDSFQGVMNSFIN
jgi:hypothetical protein